MNRDTVLVDAGTGNLHSVYNALQAAGLTVRVTDRAEDLDLAARIILPGVGVFAGFMDGLRSRGLVEQLKELAGQGVPLLGICVGMQALFETSEENGLHAGLGLLPGHVKRLVLPWGFKVPHTGWNQLWPREGTSLFEGIPAGSYAYFNHTFYCAPADDTVTACRTDYGLEITAAVCSGSLYGVQFHPEKSQQVGRRLLQNFLRIT
ncbi:MAG: imidazole glycerol phosphate synthase subunit HisH [Anaerolineaceae bacterium]